MLKIPLLVSLGHHGGRRKVASLRPPFSTPLRSLGEPDPDTPFLVPIEHAPPLFVRIWEDKISLKIPPPPLPLLALSRPRVQLLGPVLSVHGTRTSCACYADMGCVQPGSERRRLLVVDFFNLQNPNCKGIKFC